jgi:hypothetical protein
MYGVKPEIRAFKKVTGFFQYSYGFFNYFSLWISVALNRYMLLEEIHFVSHIEESRHYLHLSYLYWI